MSKKVESLKEGRILKMVDSLHQDFNERRLHDAKVGVVGTLQWLGN
jgi:hypothetical protein